MNGASSSGVANNISSDFAAVRGEWVEVLSAPFTTRYGEVYWKRLPDIALPVDFTTRFSARVCAFVGYEADAIREVVGEDGAVRQGTHALVLP